MKAITVDVTYSSNQMVEHTCLKSICLNLSTTSVVWKRKYPFALLPTITLDNCSSSYEICTLIVVLGLQRKLVIISCQNEINGRESFYFFCISLWLITTRTIQIFICKNTAHITTSSLLLTCNVCSWWQLTDLKAIITLFWAFDMRSLESIYLISHRLT